MTLVISNFNETFFVRETPHSDMQVNSTKPYYARHYAHLIFHFTSFAFTLWSRTAKIPDVSTWPLACLFAHSLAPLTRLLAPLTCLLARHCLLCSCSPLTRSLTCSLTHSRAHGEVNGWLSMLCSCFVLDHSAFVASRLKR